MYLLVQTKRLFKFKLGLYRMKKNIFVQSWSCTSKFLSHLLRIKMHFYTNYIHNMSVINHKQF